MSNLEEIATELSNRIGPSQNQWASALGYGFTVIVSGVAVNRRFPYHTHFMVSKGVITPLLPPEKGEQTGIVTVGLTILFIGNRAGYSSGESAYYFAENEDTQQAVDRIIDGIKNQVRLLANKI